MSQNNLYAPPQVASGPREPLVRKRWIAVLLGLLAPPIAMLYVLRPLRAVVYLVLALASLPVAVLAGAKGFADPNVITGSVSILLSLIAAADGYRLARGWSGSILPWYSRPPALIAFLAAGWLTIMSQRALVTEPFRIPSSSMRPTLQVGDHILVSKSAYGWDLPLSGRRIVRFAGPRRGDVAVFRYPEDPGLFYVMRVVGLPGETVRYGNKRLQIDGREMPTTEDGREEPLVRYNEQLDDIRHGILLDPSQPPLMRSAVRDFEGRDACRYDDASFTCKVPVEHYFVMGDNRDNANDSRYWGFVPEHYFIGRAFLIWYSAQDSGRAGSAIQ